MGAQTVREVASKTSDVAGDGTAARLASFFLGTLFGFGELLLQAFHFFLALLERDTHNAPSQVR